MDCDECEDLMIHRYKSPKCEDCMGVIPLPGNRQAIDIYFTIKSLGSQISFESVDRAMHRFGVVDDNIFRKIAVLNSEYEKVKAEKRKQAKRNGPKRG